MKNGPKTVLVVDDEEGVREVVSEAISSMGFMVHRAESGEKALDMMSEKRIDMVITDVKMEGMDGVALARRLRDRFPKLPLALMTAYPSDMLEQMLQEKKVDYLLEKPFLMKDLEGLVLNLTE